MELNALSAVYAVFLGLLIGWLLSKVFIFFIKRKMEKKKSIAKKVFIKRIKALFIRIQVAWHIVSHQRHGVCLYATEEQLIEIIQDNECSGEIKMSYFGLMRFQSFQLIIQAAGSMDEIEIALDKAAFEAKVQEQNQNK